MSFLSRLQSIGNTQSAVVPYVPPEAPVLTAGPRLAPRRPHPALEERAVSDSIVDLLTRMRGVNEVVYRVPSTNEALGVPAIFRAVTLIGNLIGSMTMRAWRNGIELAAEDRPRLIVRPDPFNIPREFFRQTGYSMARYGEFDWWVAARDADGNALSLICVPPREVEVTDNPADLRFPIIKWRGVRQRNSDWVLGKLTGDVGALRGQGPLQACGAAASIAVEAQAWAANFYAMGGYPSVVVKSAIDMADEEIDAFKTAWIATPNNTPRVIDPTIEEIQELGADLDAKGMIESRNWQNGDAARMFGMPGKLLEYALQGSSITYQNVGQVFDDFLRTTLGPDYLETIEQNMSDLLPRSTTSEFNRAELLKADIATTANVSATLYEKGVIDQNEARGIVGFAPDIENAAVPFSSPQAFPSSFGFEGRALPEGIAPREFRCPNPRSISGVMRRCNTYLGNLIAGGSAYCHKCGELVPVGG